MDIIMSRELIKIGGYSGNGNNKGLVIKDDKALHN
jgi:hypothetical protein